MNHFEKTLHQLSISQADFARGAGLSKAGANRLVKQGLWPKRNAEQACRCALDFLKQKGAKPAQLSSLKRALNLSSTQNKAASATVTSSAEAIPDKPSKKSMEDSMLLEFTPLTQTTRQLFGLSSNPFDVQELEDVFRSKQTSFISASLEDTARNHSFLALTGESGSGKTTLVTALEEKLRSRDDIVLIRPHVLAMELNDIKGKTLKSSQIVEAIASTLAPDMSLRRTPEARFRQIEKMLLDSLNVGHKHLVVIEEAHCLPTATLKHLKRFLDLQDGFRRLLGILLIGQTELKIRLSSQNPELREVAQRCEILELPPLDNYLEDYLKHRFARAGVKYEQVFDKDAADAIRTRLTSIPRGGKTRDAKSMCYPLVVNNLVSRAMNAAASAGFAQVNAQIIEGC